MRKRKFASCLTVYVAKTASPGCADEKASPRVFITQGSKDFMAAGKQRLAGDIVRQANTNEVTTLRREARGLQRGCRRTNPGTALTKKKHGLRDGDELE